MRLTAGASPAVTTRPGAEKVPLDPKLAAADTAPGFRAESSFRAAGAEDPLAARDLHTEARQDDDGFSAVVCWRDVHSRSIHSAAS